jgi:hypothetical protein
MVGVFKFDLETNVPLSVISLVAGVIFSPHAANLIKPLEYAGSEVGHEPTAASASQWLTRTLGKSRFHYAVL